VSLGAGMVYLRSSKHKLVTTSSTEAELICLLTASTIARWFRYFLVAQGYIVASAVIYQANQSTLVTSKPKRHKIVIYERTQTLSLVDCAKECG